MADKSIQLLVFSLNEQHYALYLHAVERIVRSVEVTLLPKAPEIILGVINLQGKIIPVVNIRKRFGLSEREIDLSDQFIIAHTSRRTVAMVVDTVSKIIKLGREKMIPAEKITPDIKYIEGVIKLKDDIILIHDLDKFLFLEEEKILDHAMDKNK